MLRCGLALKLLHGGRTQGCGANPQRGGGTVGGARVKGRPTWGLWWFTPSLARYNPKHSRPEGFNIQKRKTEHCANLESFCVTLKAKVTNGSGVMFFTPKTKCAVANSLRYPEAKHSSAQAKR